MTLQAETHVDEFESQGQSPGRRPRAADQRLRETITTLLVKYPTALVCQRCARLVTTDRLQYAPRIADPAVWTCGECRVDADPERSQRISAEIKARVGAAGRLLRPPLQTYARAYPPAHLTGAKRGAWELVREAANLLQNEAAVAAIVARDGVPVTRRSLRAGCSRQESILSGTSARSQLRGRRPFRRGRKVSSASLAALDRINARKRP